MLAVRRLLPADEEPGASLRLVEFAESDADLPKVDAVAAMQRAARASVAPNIAASKPMIKSGFFIFARAQRSISMISPVFTSR